jgi:hypothetical protein
MIKFYKKKIKFRKFTIMFNFNNKNQIRAKFDQDFTSIQVIKL